MQDNKDYSKWTLEELLAEEKKFKKKEITTSVIIGFLIGVIIYAVVVNGIRFVSVFIPLILIGGVYKQSQKLKENHKQIQTEIEARSAE